MQRFIITIEGPGFTDVQEAELRGPPEDGDLIVSLAESRTAQLVVKALVDVAQGTGAETIAVFASDQQTLEMLRELGVDYAQGHKVGQPRPIAEALSELEAQGLRSVETPIAQAASGTRKRAK